MISSSLIHGSVFGFLAHRSNTVYRPNQNIKYKLNKRTVQHLDVRPMIAVSLQVVDKGGKGRPNLLARLWEHFPRKCNASFNITILFRPERSSPLVVYINWPTTASIIQQVTIWPLPQFFAMVLCSYASMPTWPASSSSLEYVSIVTPSTGRRATKVESGKCTDDALKGMQIIRHCSCDKLRLALAMVCTNDRQIERVVNGSSVANMWRTSNRGWENANLSLKEQMADWIMWRSPAHA